MHRLSAAKACFLSDSTEDTPKPDELLQTLNEVIRVWFFFHGLIQLICDLQYRQRRGKFKLLINLERLVLLVKSQTLIFGFAILASLAVIRSIQQDRN